MRTTLLLAAVAALLLSGCYDTKKPAQTLETCPKAVARLGKDYEIARPRKIGSPGIDAPTSVNNCTHRAHIEYAGGESYLYFSEREEDRCFHLFTPTTQTHDVGGGKMIQIDPNTGAAILLSSDSIRWFGAGVATDAPVLQ